MGHDYLRVHLKECKYEARNIAGRADLGTVFPVGKTKSKRKQSNVCLLFVKLCLILDKQYTNCSNVRNKNIYEDNNRESSLHSLLLYCQTY